MKLSKNLHHKCINKKQSNIKLTEKEEKINKLMGNSYITKGSEEIFKPFHETFLLSSLVGGT